MKILYWTDGFWPRLGGIEVQSLHFVHAMKNHGHTFCVIAQQDYPNWPVFEKHHDIEIHRFDFHGIVTKKNIGEFKRIDHSLREIQQRFKPDIVHIQTATGPVAFVFWMLRKILTCHSVLTIHGLIIENNEIDPMIHRMIHSVDAACCVSDSLLQQIRQFIPAENATSIYNGLALPTVQPTPLSFDPPIVMMLGRLSPEKGFDTAMHAINQLKKQIPTVRFWIVGHGPEKQALQALATKLNLHQSIEWKGYIEPYDIPAMINQASMVLMPSRFEAFGLSALQAMQMQRPVIATRAGGLTELVVNQQTGMLIDIDHIDQLAESMLWLIRNPSIASDWGVAARQRAIQLFSIDRLVDNYSAIYSKLRSLHECIQ